MSTTSLTAPSAFASKACQAVWIKGAGILFNLKPNGDYLAIRANCLENNLVLWKFRKRPAFLGLIGSNTPTASHQWHDLKVRIAGNKVEGCISTANCI